MTEDEQDKPPQSHLKRLISHLYDGPEDLGELKSLLQYASGNGLIDAHALAMIEGVMQVAEMRVRDIMIPRANMVALDRDDKLEEILPVVIESAHSRFPVIANDKGTVVGILLAKDLLAYSIKTETRPFDIRELLRSSVVVPESKRLNVLLNEFRASRNHMAIVVDEYGTASGLVTIEDVLEQIVGDIEDEHDFDEGTSIIKRSDSEFTAKALTPIDEFNEYFSASFDEDEFDTIGGLITKELGHLPQNGEQVNIGSFRFKILRADSRRVHLLNIRILPKTENPEKQEE